MPRGIPRRLSEGADYRSAAERASVAENQQAVFQGSANVSGAEYNSAAQLIGESSSGAPKGKRRRRASVGGYALRLDAPQRKGYVRRWFNDADNRIADAEELAYDFVTERGIKSDSPDSRVRRIVGTKKSGEPMYAYLMETPLEEYEVGVSEKEARHRQIDDAIREGRDATGRLENQYGEGSIKTGR